MATQLDPGQDQRGKQLADKSTPLDQHGAKPLNAGEQSTLDQMEAGLKDDKSGDKNSGAGKLGGANGPGAGAGTDKGIGDKLAGGLTGGPKNMGQALKFVSQNRKKFGIGGGAGGLLALIIFGFMALLPLKIESMMANIFSDHFDKTLNHVIERRAERMFFKYLMTNSNAAGKDAVVATGNPLLDLYATWRLANFEAQLKLKYGLDVQKAGKGRISIKTPSEGLKYFDLEHPDSLRKYYNDDRTLTRRESRNFIKDAVRQETKWYQVLKRHHLRVWMRNAYGVGRWKVFDNAKDKKEAEEQAANRVKTWFTDKFKDKFIKAFSCVLGDRSSCPGKSSEGGSDTPDERPDGGRDAERAVAGAVDDVAEKTAAKEFFDKMVTVLTKKGFTKAIPIIGWIDLAARLDDFIWHDRADAIIENMRKAQYAAAFAEGQVMADQQKSGENTSGYDIQETMLKADGIEKSCRYQELYNGKRSNGCVNIDADKHVKAINGARFKEAFYAEPQTKATHYLLAGYLHTIGWVLDQVGKLIGWVFDKAIAPVLGFIMDSIPGADKVMGFITSSLATLFKNLFAPGCTGNEKGAEWFICVDGGGEVVSEEYNQQTGAPKVSAAAAAEIDAQVAKENGLNEASKGFWYRVGSTANPKSFLMRLAGGVPSNPGEAIGSGVNTMVASLGSLGINIAKLLAMPAIAGLTPAYADADESITGVDHYRYTEDQLDQEVNEDDLKAAQATATAAGRKDDIHPEDCPNADKAPNLCKADIITIQSLKSVFTTDDDGGVGGTTTGGGQASNGTACTNVPAGGAGEPPSDYARNTKRGVTLNNRTLWMLEDAEKRAGIGKFRLMQGSYNAGGVAASGGTHDGGGAMDIASTNVNVQLKALREAGFAAWYRTPAEGFPYHIHAIAIGDKEVSSGAAIQIKNYFDGDDGLVGPAKDTAPASVGRPIPDWAKKYGNCK